MLTYIYTNVYIHHEYLNLSGENWTLTRECRPIERMCKYTHTHTHTHERTWLLYLLLSPSPLFSLSLSSLSLSLFSLSLSLSLFSLISYLSLKSISLSLSLSLSCKCRNIMRDCRLLLRDAHIHTHMYIRAHISMERIYAHPFTQTRVYIQM